MIATRRSTVDYHLRREEEELAAACRCRNPIGRSSHHELALAHRIEARLLQSYGVIGIDRDAHQHVSLQSITVDVHWRTDTERPDKAS